jgi:phospholipase C
MRVRSRPTYLAAFGLLAFVLGLVSPAAVPVSSAAEARTTTPIKHLIVIIGENQSFDALFATYTPRSPRVSVRNLLSEDIIRADGTPGPRFLVAA